MAKVTTTSDSATTKKRSRKTSPENGKGVQIAEPVATSSGFVRESQSPPPLEEKIRARAYELFLQRDGTGGSPEQDWLRAKQEVCGRA
jgi:hypothetical protein